MRRRSFVPSLALALIVVLAAPLAAAFADTIRLRDGTVIRGQIVSFRDQQFTVLLGTGSRGRRSRVTLYMEDVESIEFEETGTTSTAAGGNDTTGDGDFNSEPRATPTPITTNTNRAPAASNPRPSSNSGSSARTNTTTTTPRTTAPAATTSAPSASSSSATPSFFQVNVRVRADNTANGWTNSGLVVRRGQRVRISASGRVFIGGGRFSTPTGLPRTPDNDKLMRDQPTGALIAVIGDDNDDFIFVGSRHDFVAQRDGILFLGVNESNLADNTGNYDAVIEAETAR